MLQAARPWGFPPAVCNASLNCDEVINAVPPRLAGVLAVACMSSPTTARFRSEADASDVAH